MAVLAGGRGSRISATIGATTPKLLAPVGKHRFLDLLLAQVRQFGARRVFLLLGHLADTVTEYVAAHPEMKSLVHVIVEPSLLGTAGAIRNARTRLSTDPVLILNGDTLINVDLCAFLYAHRTAQAEVTVMMAESAASESDSTDCDAARDPQPKAGAAAPARRAAAVSAGFYLMSPAALDKICNCTATSLERGVLDENVVHVSAWPTRSRFIDIGVPASLRLADSRWREFVGRDAL